MKPKPIAKKNAKDKDSGFLCHYNGWDIFDIGRGRVSAFRPNSMSELWDSGYDTIEECKRTIDEL